jgi:hypothetical protein
MLSTEVVPQRLYELAEVEEDRWWDLAQQALSEGICSMAEVAEEPTLEADGYERLQELYEGQALYKIHVDKLREQDKNARLMTRQTFERLAENIKRHEKLRSIPLAVKGVNPSGNVEFYIISGHHRIRAARSAGIREIFVMVEEGELTRDEVVAEQLAQNALQGQDDPQVLAELFEEIEDLNAKLETGLNEQDLKLDLRAPHIDSVELDLDFELVNVLFMSHQYERWKEAVELIADDAHLYIADSKDWERFAETVRTVSKREGIRNIAAIITRMVDIVMEKYADEESK